MVNFKRVILFTLLFLSGFLFFATCDTTNSLENIPSEYTELPGTLIPRDTVWAGQHRLKGQHYIMPGVTLTIEKGTTAEWEYHNGDIKDVGTRNRIELTL